MLIKNFLLLSEVLYASLFKTLNNREEHREELEFIDELILTF